MNVVKLAQAGPRPSGSVNLSNSMHWNNVCGVNTRSLRCLPLAHKEFARIRGV